MVRSFEELIMQGREPVQRDGHDGIHLPVFRTLDEVSHCVLGCHRCPLGETAIRPVPGTGNPHARIVIVGEAPGAKEDQLGMPFVGASGKFLDALFAHIGLAREDVFITNVVKCRPPNNRDPHAAEIAACDDYLQQQVRIIQPEVIVTLGRFSLAKFLPEVTIADVHGTLQTTPQGYTLMPLYHPAAALYNPKLRPVMFGDMEKLAAFLHLTVHP